MITKHSLIAGIFFAMLALLISCSQAPEGKTVDAGEAEEIVATNATDTLVVDTATSVINWEGTEPGDEGHYGDMRIKSGTILVNDGAISGGQFVIDMESINVTDLEGNRKTKLEGHLKAGDFFETEKYPEATFTIAEVNPTEGDSTANYIIKGNLQMKDSTKSIEIPAQVSIGEAMVTATTPPFTIDRTQWGVMYRSTALGTLKNKLINDRIGLTINLEAKK
ncbi:MAG: YceI family protein [Bacteroidota bacterium]